MSTMPANRKLQPKFKAHVGRTFSLRKVKCLLTFTSATISTGDDHLVDRVKEIGEAVFVLDESNTRVCVISSTGQAIWIQKYHLHKEVISGVNKIEDTLTEIIAKILEVSKNLRENVLLYSQAQTLENTASDLRKLADKYGLEGKK
ncbi:MAG: hypothetical protein WC761_02230 [Candidatus Paceibacterota bacterium]|jgi:hypothetical protein